MQKIDSINICINSCIHRANFIYFYLPSWWNCNDRSCWPEEFLCLVLHLVGRECLRSNTHSCTAGAYARQNMAKLYKTNEANYARICKATTYGCTKSALHLTWGKQTMFEHSSHQQGTQRHCRTSLHRRLPAPMRLHDQKSSESSQIFTSWTQLITPTPGPIWPPCWFSTATHGSLASFRSPAAFCLSGGTVNQNGTLQSYRPPWSTVICQQMSASTVSKYPALKGRPMKTPFSPKSFTDCDHAFKWLYNWLFWDQRRFKGIHEESFTPFLMPAQQELRKAHGANSLIAAPHVHWNGVALRTARRIMNRCWIEKEANKKKIM